MYQHTYVGKKKSNTNNNNNNNNNDNNEFKDKIIKQQYSSRAERLMRCICLESKGNYKTKIT